MDDPLFNSKFSSIMKKLGDAQSYYEFKPGETWDNVGTNPLDIAYTELSELYLEADSAQRKYIFEQAELAKLPSNLWHFIRRVAKHIQFHEDAKWVEIGLAASLIDGARADFRDLITSLVLLRFAAEIHEIDTKPYFDNAIKESDEKLKPILLNVCDHSESDVHFVIQNLGWTDLMDESKNRFGEHPLIAKIRNKKPPRQTNCSTILIGLFIIIVILGIAVFLF